MKVADLFDIARTSDCSTTFFRSPGGGVKDCYRNIDNGYVEGGLAISLHDRTYTGARVCVSNNEMPLGTNPVEDLRLCVFDYETKVLRATTDNLAAEMNAAPRFTAIPDEKYDFEGEFTEPLSLFEGERVILATALYGQYPCRNIRIVNEVAIKSLMARYPQLGFNRKSAITHAVGPNGYPSGDYVGGVPETVGTEPSGNYPSMDLLPFPDA